MHRTFAIYALNFLVAASAVAAPPAGSSADGRDSGWYRGLRQPDTHLSCCDIADCRPTDLRADPASDVHWQAFVSKAIYGPDAPDAWVTIPSEKILPQMDNPTGRVVVCWFMQDIRCAVLPSLT